MHFCGSVTTATTATVVAVSDDAITCDSLAMIEVQVPVQTYLVPPMSASTGALVALTVVACWATAYAISAIIDTFQLAGETK